ncbi:hypothetical protein KY284_035176 [Solanum tuberosum]|nr:hypothetical protein KY284_035176 [Solanum tuberosum]
MHSHPKVNSYVPDWDRDSDWSSCSPLVEPLTTDENSNDLNIDVSVVVVAAPKASTLGLFARTTDVPSPAFNMLSLFLGGELTEWMRALLP